MACTLLITLLLIILAYPSSADRSLSPQQSTTPVIAATCVASRDPPSCEDALTKLTFVPPDANAFQVIQSALNVTLKNLDKAIWMTKDILAGASGNRNLTTAAKVCGEILGYSRYRVALAAHRGLQGPKIKDGRAWVSAALGYQYDSWSALKKENHTAKVINTMALINDTIMAMTSTALNMLANYDVHGENLGSWGPVKTEREGYWEPVKGDRYSRRFDFKGGVPRGLKPNVTVCKSEGCDYMTVQEAVNAAPSLKSRNLFVIWIKAGVYKEMVRVSVKKLNIVFLGDGMGQTVITGALHSGIPGMNTYGSATVGVVGDGFMACNMTFENKGIGYQAVAFRSDADHTLIESCEFLGNQDTLYVKSLRQYYKSCRIQGNVDFIFGNSAAYFEDCEILFSARPDNEAEKGETNAVSAHGRIDPAQTIGFVFQNCIINGTEQYLKVYYKNPSVHRNYLGRPWKEFCRTVFIMCSFGDIVSKDGWFPWKDDYALTTLYYGEFQNRGAGADTSGRVNWSSIIPPQHVYSYTVPNFIQGDTWIPQSGRAYI
nr:probable pectinesterase/pectinesterase inhibitor 51 [Ipomoea batatas]